MMAENAESRESRREPIKVILAQTDDHRRHPGAGGGGRTLFDGGATPEVRDRLISELSDVREYFDRILSPESSLPVVAKVVLKRKALAKSHRPLTLLNKNTCPIIGGGDFGDLLVHVSRDGLNRLENKFRTDKSDSIQAQISTIDFIEPFKVEDSAGQLGLMEMTSAIKTAKTCDVQLRLFDHKNDTDNGAIRTALFELASALNLPEPKAIPFISELRIYRMEDVKDLDLPHLAAFVGTQSVSFFSQFTFDLQYLPCGQVTKENFPRNMC